jgi:hypothetical protein
VRRAQLGDRVVHDAFVDVLELRRATLANRVDRCRGETGCERVLLVRLPGKLRRPLPRDDDDDQFVQPLPELRIARHAVVEPVHVVGNFGHA